MAHCCRRRIRVPLDPLRWRERRDSSIARECRRSRSPSGEVTKPPAHRTSRGEGRPDSPLDRDVPAQPKSKPCAERRSKGAGVQDLAIPALRHGLNCRGAAPADLRTCGPCGRWRRRSAIRSATRTTRSGTKSRAPRSPSGRASSKSTSRSISRSPARTATKASAEPVQLRQLVGKKSGRSSPRWGPACKWPRGGGLNTGERGPAERSWRPGRSRSARSSGRKTSITAAAGRGLAPAMIPQIVGAVRRGDPRGDAPLAEEMVS